MIAFDKGDRARVLRLTRALVKEEPTAIRFLDLAVRLERDRRYRAAARWYATAIASSDSGTRQHVFATRRYQRVQEHLRSGARIENDQDVQIEAQIRQATLLARTDPAAADLQLRNLRRLALRFGFSDLASDCLGGRAHVAAKRSDWKNHIRLLRAMAEECPEPSTFISLGQALESFKHFQAACNAYRAALDKAKPGEWGHSIAVGSLKRVEERLRSSGGGRGIADSAKRNPAR
jgi:hypothetical protein